MTNKYTRKKGMTLIEAIISVALFSILIIPISGLVMTAMKTSEKAEAKQEASYIGQGILEEMNIYDEITIKDGKFKFLDGGEIYEDSKNLYKDKGNIIRDGFNAEVTLNKDSNFEYKLSSDADSDDSKMDYILTLSKNVISGKTEVKCGNKIEEMPNDSILKIDESGRMTLNDNTPNKIVVEKPKVSNNKISIYLDKTFSNKEINIDVENEKKNVTGNKEVLEVYIKSSKDVTDKLNVTGTKGKVKVYENIVDIPRGEMGDLYNIQVDVKKNSDVLFTGKTTKNIVFK
ncbi:type II secretion system GspH family protein [Clostridium gasigenes]|uniref:type IV pilus modification PilV family protein n=1 Tax=Clostridium gasigenes TaxID=94869 RepID=UPI001C0BFC32|nr:type II secretion system protein [Clostridium gasigenes]MBU3133632.1 type II secretion system GspH family protein [Clostridium gasigenes]